jgi:hypothetical protein
VPFASHDIESFHFPVYSLYFRCAIIDLRPKAIQQGRSQTRLAAAALVDVLSPALPGANNGIDQQ